MVAGPEDAIAVEEEDLPESERRWKHESVTVERCKGFCNAPEWKRHWFLANIHRTCLRTL